MEAVELHRQQALRQAAREDLKKKPEAINKNEEHKDRLVLAKGERDRLALEQKIKEDRFALEAEMEEDRIALETLFE